MKFLKIVLFEKSINKIKNKSVRNYFLTFFSVKQILVKFLIFLVMSSVLASISFVAREYALNNWDYELNPGVAFSLGKNLHSNVIITIQAVPIVFSFVAYIFINNVYLYLPLTFIFIGGSCNLIDRFIPDYGFQGGDLQPSVVDYIYCSTSIFNFPDIIIVAGCIIFAISCLIYLLIITIKENKKEKEELIRYTNKRNFEKNEIEIHNF